MGLRLSDTGYTAASGGGIVLAVCQICQIHSSSMILCGQAEAPCCNQIRQEIPYGNFISPMPSVFWL